MAYNISKVAHNYGPLAFHVLSIILMLAHNAEQMKCLHSAASGRQDQAGAARQQLAVELPDLRG